MAGVIKRKLCVPDMGTDKKWEIRGHSHNHVIDDTVFETQYLGKFPPAEAPPIIMVDPDPMTREIIMMERCKSPLPLVVFNGAAQAKDVTYPIGDVVDEIRVIDASAPVDWPAALKRIKEYSDAGLEVHEPIQIVMPDIHGHSHEFDEQMKRVMREMPAAFGIPPELLYGDKAGSIMQESVTERDIKIAKLKMLGVDYDVSGFTDEKLDLALKIIGNYKNGARCDCGAKAEYYTGKGFVCFEHSGMSLSSASPKPLKIPDIIGPPKNRAERRKNKRKTWNRR